MSPVNYTQLIEQNNFDQFFSHFDNSESIEQFYNTRGGQVQFNKVLDIVKAFIKIDRLDQLLHFFEKLAVVYKDLDLLSIYLNSGLALEYAVTYGKIDIIKYMLQKFQPLLCNYHYQNQILRIIPTISNGLEILNLLESVLNGGLVTEGAAQALVCDRLDIFEKLDAIKTITPLTTTELEIPEGTTFDVIKKLHTTGRDNIYLPSLSIRSLLENNRLDIIQYLVENKVITGSINNLKHLRKSSKIIEQVLPLLYSHGISLDISVRDVMRSATVQLMEFLNNNTEAAKSCKFSWSPSVMNLACEYGNLEVVAWLNNNRTEGCTTSAVDAAAEENYIQVVEFLHKNRTEGCSATAMDYAAKNGHIEMLNFLLKNGLDKCSQHAMSRAVENNHYEVVMWLHNNLNLKCPFEAVKTAIANKVNNDIIVYLVSNELIESVDYISLAGEAINSANLPLFQLFMANSRLSNIDTTCHLPLQKLFTQACFRNAIDIIRDLLVNNLPAIKLTSQDSVNQTMYDAIDRDLLAIIKIVDQHFTVASSDIITFMFKRPNMVVSVYPGGPTHERQLICTSVDCNVLKYFIETRKDFTLDNECITRCLRDGRHNVAAWLIKYHPEMFNMKELSTEITGTDGNDKPEAFISALNAFHLDTNAGLKMMRTPRQPITKN